MVITAAVKDELVPGPAGFPTKNTIRRADHSDQSSEPDGLKATSAPKNELAVGPADRPVERTQWPKSHLRTKERIGPRPCREKIPRFLGTGGFAHEFEDRFRSRITRVLLA